MVTHGTVRMTTQVAPIKKTKLCCRILIKNYCITLYSEILDRLTLVRPVLVRSLAVLISSFLILASFPNMDSSSRYDVGVT